LHFQMEGGTPKEGLDALSPADAAMILLESGILVVLLVDLWLSHRRKGA